MLRNGNLGTKKEKHPKNLDRLAAAHSVVESLDSDLQKCQTNFNSVKQQSERKAFTDEYKRKKILLDSAYTELKRAQDATVKSINVQKQQINSCLESLEDSE